MTAIVIFARIFISIGILPLKLSERRQPGLIGCNSITDRTNSIIDRRRYDWRLNLTRPYHRSLRDEMEHRDVDPNELRDLFERAREQGYTKDEIVDETTDTPVSRHSSTTPRSDPLCHEIIRPPRQLRIAPTAGPRRRAGFPDGPRSSSSSRVCSLWNPLPYSRTPSVARTISSM